MEMVLAGLFVFCMRVTDMSLDTVRLLFVMRGRKLLAGSVGAIQAAVFIVAVSQVLTRPLNPLTVIGYAAGFGVGVILGIIVEERLALGYAMFRIYSPACGKAIAAALREKGYAVTEIVGRGQSGFMTVVNCVVGRKDIGAVQHIVELIDASAFITMDQVQTLQRGYFRH